MTLAEQVAQIHHGDFVKAKFENDAGYFVVEAIACQHHFDSLRLGPVLLRTDLGEPRHDLIAVLEHRVQGVPDEAEQLRQALAVESETVDALRETADQWAMSGRQRAYLRDCGIRIHNIIYELSAAGRSEAILVSEEARDG